jgi:hypothetical protein
VFAPWKQFQKHCGHAVADGMPDWCSLAQADDWRHSLIRQKSPLQPGEMLLKALRIALQKPMRADEIMLC